MKVVWKKLYIWQEYLSDVWRISLRPCGAVMEIYNESLQREVCVGQKRYKLVNNVGSGGNGSVWRVQEEGTGQQYAIKFIVVESCLKQKPSERPSSNYLVETVSCTQQFVKDKLGLIEDSLIDELEDREPNENIISITRIAAKDSRLAVIIIATKYFELQKE